MMMDLKRQIKPGEVVPSALPVRAVDGTASTAETNPMAGFAPPAI